MNNKPCCSIKLFEFVQIDGWYWEITVPGEIHPRERIKEFILDDPGLGWLLKLKPVGSVNPVSYSLGENVYRGVLSDRLVADAIKSTIEITSFNESVTIDW